MLAISCPWHGWYLRFTARRKIIQVLSHKITWTQLHIIDSILKLFWCKSHNSIPFLFWSIEGTVDQARIEHHAKNFLVEILLFPAPASWLTWSALSCAGGARSVPCRMKCCMAVRWVASSVRAFNSAFRISFSVRRERGRPSVLLLVQAISKVTVSDEEAVVDSESHVALQQVQRIQVLLILQWLKWERKRHLSLRVTLARSDSRLRRSRIIKSRNSPSMVGLPFWANEPYWGNFKDSFL